MSNSLVRQGLELLGYEKDIKHGKKKRKQVKYKGTFDLIPLKHRIITKESKTDLGTVFNQSSKLTVYEAQKKKANREDPTDETVKKLLRLSKNSIDADTTKKLLDRAIQRKYLPKKQKPKEPETTAFTEEDFKKFEEEYIDQ